MEQSRGFLGRNLDTNGSSGSFLGPFRPERAQETAERPAFIGFGAVDGTKPYEFIGFGAMDGTKPYEFIGFGAVDGTKIRPKSISKSPETALEPHLGAFTSRVPTRRL